MNNNYDIVYTCTNPQVLDRTLMCDGNCWTCGYHQPKQNHIGELKVIHDTDSYNEGKKAAYEEAYQFMRAWRYGDMKRNRWEAVNSMRKAMNTFIKKYELNHKEFED